MRHRSRIARDPGQPNLRQVHLLHFELFEELMAANFAVWPGDLGENITASGIDLLALPTGTRLHIGAAAVVEVTGLRNPCSQLDRFQPGLMAALLGRDSEGGLIRKAGVMGVVAAGGEVKAGDRIARRCKGPTKSPAGRARCRASGCLAPLHWRACWAMGLPGAMHASSPVDWGWSRATAVPAARCAWLKSANAAIPT